MYIRRAFTQFLEVQSEAAPLPASTVDWTLDWRWFCEPVVPNTLPSERSLIDWPAWAKPKKPSRGSSVRR
jgi:hypothetical protein